jgi:molybdopterin-guanine dinucleotide biosynthesis protein A
MDERVGSGKERRVVVAVLAGGRARRMGAPKATAELDGRPLISYPLQAAREAGLDAVVLAKRTSELPPLCERVVCEPERPHHPLCGIVTALEYTGGPVLAVGCDMPFLSAGLLAWLARGGEEADDAAARVTRVDARLQPLPAVYLPAALPVLEASLVEERSLRATLELLEPRVVDEDALCEFGDPARLCFSVNDARDMELATRWMEG